MRVFVYFGAANYQTAVYLNGEKLGEHEGGFTPFNFEATSSLRDGENFLIVEVINMRRPDAVPALKFDWWNYGGITRDVSLVEVPGTFIQDYCVQLAHGSQGEISGWVQLNGATSPQKITLDIPEAGVHETFATDAAGRANFHFIAKVKLWSPADPKLYDVALTSGAYSVHDQIGFRTIEVRASQILDPAEKSLRVLRAEGASFAKGSLLVHRNTAQEDRLAVQQNLGPSHLDGSKTNLIVNSIGTTRERHDVEFRISGGPQLDLGGEVKVRPARRVGGKRFVNPSFRNVQRNLLRRLCAVQLHPARNLGLRAARQLHPVILYEGARHLY